MIEHSLDKEHSVLYVRPKSALEQGDFAQLANTVDPYIKETGDLSGIIIEAPKFPGWESLGAMASHFRFVREHHKHIKKIGLVTDSAMGNVAEHLASHFVSAKIRHFPAGQLEAAKRWVMGQDPA
jgi:stage II sporulation SpoAA-like protein